MAVNVPNVLGVPAVDFLDAAISLAFLTADAVGLFSGGKLGPWGIYLGGAPVVIADNVVAFDYQQQWAVSDYPVERGSFESYDKVAIPFNARFRFTAGGSEANRSALLASIEAIAPLTGVTFDILTPEAIYNSATITRYNYARASNNGLGLMIVDVWTEEIRQNAVLGLSSSSTQSPISAPQTNAGAVQTSAATPLEDTRREAILSNRPEPATFGPR